MKEKRTQRTHGRRLMALVLVAALLAGLIPLGTAAAAEIPVGSIAINAQMQSAFTGKPISTYYAEEGLAYGNYYQNPAALSMTCDSPLEWTLFSFAIHNNQNVQIELYEMSDEYQASLENPVGLSRNDASATEPEEFLGEYLGYVAAIQITEVATPGAEEGWYDYVPLTPGELHDLARDYVLAGTQPTKMDDVLVYGIYGEPYESEPETPSITTSSVHVPEDFEYQEELAFSVPMDGTIQNYFLWDGTVVDKNGDLVEVDYASGATKYVIVVTPETEENKIYNQFISFIVDPQSAFL